MPRFPLIVLEGCDAAGKSTLSWKIAHHIEGLGLRRVRTKEPYTSATAAHALTLTSPDARALVYEADRISREREIEKILNVATVIQDRSFYSTIVYQDPSPGVREFILRPRRIEPDLVLLLDLPAGAARKRLEARGELDAYEQSVALQEKLRWRYRALLASSEKAVLIDASQSPEQVTKEALEKVDVLLERMGIV